MDKRALYAVIGLSVTTLYACNRSQAADYQNGKWRPAQPDKSSDDGTTVGDQERDLDFAWGGTPGRPKWTTKPAKSPPAKVSDEADERQLVRGQAETGDEASDENDEHDEGTGQFGGPSRGGGL